MSTASAARGPNWPGFAAAALVLLLICFAALIGDMLGGGGTMIGIVAVALGYLAVAAGVERKWRNRGIAMLLLSPIALFALGAIFQIVRGLR